MKTAFFIIFVLFAIMQSGNCDKNRVQNSQTNKGMQNTEKNISPTPKAATKFERLPENITLETEVRKDVKNDKGEVVSFETTTVEKRLSELKARYEKDKLVDEKGREIRFFEPFCRGVSAGFEQDQADQKAKDNELAELEKKYTVIVLFCDPRKIM